MNRVRPLARVAALAVVAVLGTGCGTSENKATPITGGSTPTTVPSVVPSTGRPTRTSVPPTAGSGASNRPSSGELAALQQQLNDAGSSISAADSAVVSSDVNTAKAQEGSAP